MQIYKVKQVKMANNANGWDNLMTETIDGKQYFDASTYRFEHEFNTMDKLLNGSPGLMYGLAIISLLELKINQHLF